MVVATHALAYTQLDSQARTLLACWVYSIAVPPFFIADGFLFAWGQGGEKSFSAVRYIVKSGTRLLVPWLVFSVFYATLRWAYEYWGNPSEHIILGENVSSVVAGF